MDTRQRTPQGPELELSEEIAPARANGVQVIARAAEILRALLDAPGGMTLTQLSVKVGLARTTIYRVVHTLQSEGLVTAPDPDGAVFLGPELGRLATPTSASISLRVRPFLELLAQDVKETVDLAVLYGLNVRFIDQVVPGRRLREGFIFDELLPAHSTANGKALLAALPLRTLQSMLPSQLRRCTPNTITSRRQLLVELDHVREAGFAFDREETDDGICAVGAVVYSQLGPQAAITVAAPADRFYRSEAAFAKAVATAAHQASQALSGD